MYRSHQDPTVGNVLFDSLFLQQPEVVECRDIISVEYSYSFLQELKTSPVSLICAVVDTLALLDIIINLSAFPKMQREVAWCKRFVYNNRNLFHPTI